jgi:MFS family permease
LGTSAFPGRDGCLNRGVETRLLTGPVLRVWIANLGAFTSFGALLLVLPLYARDELAASDIGVGIAVGAGSISALLFGPASGRIADRRGRRKVIVAGALVMVLGYVALALGPPLGGVALIRLLVGAGEAAFVVAALTIAVDVAPPGRRGEAVTLITVASYIGLTVGPLAADLLLGGGRFVLVWVSAALCVAIPSVGILTLGETRPQTEEEAPSGWLPPRAALGPGLLVFFGLLGFGGYNAFAALYAREIGFDHPGLIFGLFGLVVVIVRTLGRRVPDRLGGRRTLAISFVCLGIGLATIGAWQAVPGLFAGTVVFAVGQALVYPSAILLAMEGTSTAERSAVVGSVGAFVDVALGVGAFVLGAIAEVTSYGEAFLVSAAIATSGLLALAFMSRSGTAQAGGRIPA